MQEEAVKKSSIRPKRKLFLLGIDSTNLDYLLQNRTSLPNINKLIERGKSFRPESVANIFSAGVWPTFSSGVMPGEHGHYFPMQWDARSMRFIQIKNGALPFEPFWNELASEGVRTVVFDAMSVPDPAGAPGIQIINWNTQCNFPPLSNNPEMLKQVIKKYGKKPIGDEVAVKKSRKILVRHRDKLIESVRKKGDAIRWIMDTYEWDFFLTAFFEGHRAGHNLWPIWEEYASHPPEGAMLEVYEELDQQVGRLIQSIDFSKTAFVLFSLHGMKPVYDQSHFLPKIMGRVNTRYAQKSGQKRKVERPGVARLLRQSVPASIQLKVRELVTQEVQDWLIDREWRGGKIWKQTPAFAVPGGGDVGFIRLNIVDRERDGCLPASESGRKPYIKFLCESLADLRIQPTNELLIREIIDLRSVFPGERSSHLPDIAVRWNTDRPVDEIRSEELGTVKAKLKTGRGGNHTGDSFAVVTGAYPSEPFTAQLTHIANYKNFLTQLLTA